MARLLLTVCDENGLLSGSQVHGGTMRICMYTETALPKMGGQEMVVDALARQYVKLGHDVVVLAPYPRKLKARDETLPYRVARHPIFVSTRHFVSWYRWFLNRLHRKHQTEILHCHN